MADGLVDRKFEDLCNELNAASGNRDNFLEKVDSDMTTMVTAMGYIQKAVMIKEIHTTLNGEPNNSLLSEIEEGAVQIKNLEEEEMKLIVKFNEALSNMYMFPSYAMGIVSGISGLLASDPKVCGLVYVVVLAALAFLGALGSTVGYAYRHLRNLQKKHVGLASERRNLHTALQNRVTVNLNIGASSSVPAASSSAATTRASNVAGAAAVARLNVVNNFEEVNNELKSQAFYYRWVLLSISFFGVLFSIMFVAAGCSTLCGWKAI